MTQGRGAERWDRLLKEQVDRSMARLEYIFKYLLQDGYPPFHVQTDPRQQYEALVALRAANAPAYWESPEAQATLQRLVSRFGPPPAPATPPYPVPEQTPTAPVSPGRP